MVRSRRRSAKRNEFFSNTWSQFLWDGGGDTRFFGPPPGTDLCSVWEVRRDDLLFAYVAKHPAERPYGWWLCEAPEPRRCVSRQFVPAAEEERTDWRQRWGIPLHRFASIRTLNWCSSLNSIISAGWICSHP